MRQKGFTLIELMIVVGVIAILAAIAVPNFLEQSRKGRRAEALRAIGDYQLAIERYRAENPDYNCPTDKCAVPLSDYYTIGFSGVPTASTYTITATRKSGSAQANDRCGTLTATQNLQAKPRWGGDANCNQ